MEDRILNFGKYKGQKIKYILLTHIGYIMWCLENISWFRLTSEEQELYDAVALMVKKYDIETIFPKEPLYKHIKNKNLKTPLFMNGDCIAISWDALDTPLGNYVKEYIHISSYKPISLSELSRQQSNMIKEELDPYNTSDDYDLFSVHDLFY